MSARAAAAKATAAPGLGRLFAATALADLQPLLAIEPVELRAGKRRGIRSPSGSSIPFNALSIRLVWGPLVLFTLAVLIALIFVTAKVGRIERLLDDQRPHR